MNDVLTFVLLWGKCFMVFVLAFCLSEGIAIYTRPDFYPWLKANLGPTSGKSLGFKGVLFMYLTWPIPAAFLLFNLFRNRTLLEHLALSKIAERKRKEAEDKAEAELTVRLKQTQPVWKTTATSDGAIPLHLMFYYLNDKAFLTHVVVDVDGQCVCVRAMPNPKRNLPWALAPNIQEAKQECARDYEWATLCAPGREALQYRVWKKIHTRMTEGLKKLDR